MKVSFDFDGTLSRKDVQMYAKFLIEEGIEIQVLTARFNEDDEPKWPTGVKQNKDLWEVTNMLLIPNENVIFTNMQPKFEYLKDSDIVWHLDDDYTELDEIEQYTNIRAVTVLDRYYQHICNNLIKQPSN